MSRPVPHLEELIARKVAGKTTRAENALLDHWLKALELPEEDPVNARDLQRLKARIDAVVKPDIPQPKPRVFYRYAAAAVLLFVGAIALMLDYGNHTGPFVLALRNPTYPVILPDVTDMRVWHNRSDSLQTHTLSDGTKVSLTAGSSIRFVAGFAAAHRHVSLRGKALFQVARDTCRPFSVLTGAIRTTALGTVFWISHHPERHPRPIVSLLSGKVEIARILPDAGRDILATLQPGEVWRDGQRIGIAATAKSSASKIKATLKPGIPQRLDFRHAALRDVFDLLALRYGVTFTYTEAHVEGMTLYGSYPESVNLAAVLQHIALTSNLDIVYNKTRKTYVVLPRSNEINHSFHSNH